MRVGVVTEVVNRICKQIRDTLLINGDSQYKAHEAALQVRRTSPTKAAIMVYLINIISLDNLL